MATASFTTEAQGNGGCPISSTHALHVMVGLAAAACVTVDTLGINIM